MAEIYIIGQIARALDYSETNIYCKWSLQAGWYPLNYIMWDISSSWIHLREGSAWRVIEGDAQGQSVISSNCILPSVDFQLPIDVHLGTASVQGWPKLHLEIYAVNCLQNVWPIGYGFVHVPAKPGYHRVEVSTWRIAPNTWFDSIRERFGGGSLVVSKADLIYTGLERYHWLIDYWIIPNRKY